MMERANRGANTHEDVESRAGHGEPAAENAWGQLDELLLRIIKLGSGRCVAGVSTMGNEGAIKLGPEASAEWVGWAFDIDGVPHVDPRNKVHDVGMHLLCTSQNLPK